MSKQKMFSNSIQGPRPYISHTGLRREQKQLFSGYYGIVIGRVVCGEANYTLNKGEGELNEFVRKVSEVLRGKTTGLLGEKVLYQFAAKRRDQILLCLSLGCSSRESNQRKLRPSSRRTHNESISSRTWPRKTSNWGLNHAERGQKSFRASDKVTEGWSLFGDKGLLFSGGSSDSLVVRGSQSQPICTGNLSSEMSLSFLQEQTTDSVEKHPQTENHSSKKIAVRPINSLAPGKSGIGRMKGIAELCLENEAEGIFTQVSSNECLPIYFPTSVG